MSCFELLVYSCSSVELGKTCSLYSQIKFILTFSSNFLQEIKYNTITIFETESEEILIVYLLLVHCNCNRAVC